MSRPLALVTGASSGIGEAFARRLAAAGYDLVLVARRQDRLDALAGQLGAETLVADLTDERQLRHVEDRITKAANLELLVNNAGFGVRGWFWRADRDALERMHRLHVIATLRLSHAALAGMTVRGRGAIINVSSVAAFLGTPQGASYCATKAWINSFTAGLDLELKMQGCGVRVQALCPGFVRTEFHQVSGENYLRFSEGWWMRAEEVVEASLEGLERGKLFVVPGLRYKLIVMLLRCLPRSAVAGALRRLARGGRPAG